MTIKLTNLQSEYESKDKVIESFMIDNEQKQALIND